MGMDDAPLNTFFDDLAWQREVRDRVLVPWYHEHVHEGRFVLLDGEGLPLDIQRQFGADTLIQARSGDAVGIEEKIVRWKGRHYTSLCLETDSCTVRGRESDGWMHTSRADWLLYALQQPCGALRVYLIDLPALRKWFWAGHYEQFAQFGPLNTLNRAKGRLVPIEDIRGAVRMWRYQIAAPKVPF